MYQNELTLHLFFNYEKRYLFKVEAQWAEPVSLTYSVLRKLYTEPSIGASYQIRF